MTVLEYDKPATSKVGQVAVVRGDGGLLVRLLNIHQPTTTDPHGVEDDTMQDAPPAPSHPPLDDNLTVAEIAHHYGLSSGPVHTAAGKGLVAKRGTDGKRNSVYDHRELLAAIEQGFIGLPRGGAQRPAELVTLWRERVQAAIESLRLERAASRSYSNQQVAAITGGHTSSVPKLLQQRGVVPLHVPQRRGEPWRWPADAVDAALAERPAMVRSKPMQADPPPAAVVVTPPAQQRPTPTPADPTPTTSTATLMELATLRGMVSMLPEAQAGALLRQLDRVNDTLTR